MNDSSAPPLNDRFYCLYNAQSAQFRTKQHSDQSLLLANDAFQQSLNGYIRIIKSSFVTKETSKLCIALSGGLDSVVLLHLCKQWQAQEADNRHVRAIYINHNLQPESNAWQNFCCDLSKQLSVSFQSYDVVIQTGKRQGLEQAARKQRYQTLFAQLQADEVLLTAHHQDDQAETFLLNAFRQSGVIGLGAMQAIQQKGGAWHLRPLLDMSKKQLLAYAAQNNLQWIEDHSNTDTQLRRNWLRQDIFPQLEARIPSVKQNLAQTSINIQEANQLLNKLAEQQLAEVDFTPLYLTLNPNLDWAEQKNVLRYWLGHHSAHSTRLNKMLLDWLYGYWFIATKNGAELKLPSGKSLRIYQQRLYLVEEPSELLQIIDSTFIHCLQADETMKKIQWHLPEVLLDRLDQISVVTLNQLKLQNPDWYRKHKKRTKAFFQNKLIPPWERETWPVIVFNDSKEEPTEIYMLGVNSKQQPGNLKTFHLTQLQLWQLMGWL